uniref:Major capsid protein n=2 Tax=unclassified Marseillevirus TaxID=1813598 RepID=A0A7G1IQ03_9VIRU|nr:major capsid protein [Marseillevirus KS-2019]BCJ04079.1 major capsid protein [Marseillevirus JP-2020]BCJ04080.1 major capsid protein [Marseillevirus JP-2020]BCJ04082.1 major capsid protein [Marseillevirus JP-2020]BCJ04083.1 major capsid protein [Marseillevirus JP-2020]
MTSVVCGTRVTAASGFVDLATFSDLEAYLYGGCSAVTYFVRAIKKANWFSFLPVVLRNISGLPGFGNEFSASVNRSGDYVLNTWLRVRLPLIAIRPTNAGGAINANATIRWTRNFMHNLVEKVNITFNDLIVHEFDSYWFDFNSQFNIDASKRVGYRNMIGDIPAMINPVTTGNPLGTGEFFNLPIPLFYSEDSGLALAVSALPFNDIKINYCLRRWQDLLVLNVGVGANPPTLDDVVQVSYDATFTLIYSSNPPAITNVETWCHYAVVHNDERVKMGKNPRDMVIKQVQKVNETTINLSQLNALIPIDIRISHAVVGYFYAIRNSSTPGEWSNYTTEPAYAGLDPLEAAQLVYESTARVSNGSDYYSLVVPWYWHKSIPEETGYHAYSYSLETFASDPKGSTNYSKLTNVSNQYVPSTAAVNASAGVTNTGIPIPSATNPAVTQQNQTFQHIFRVLNFNVLRLSGGSLGLPIL